MNPFLDGSRARFWGKTGCFDLMLLITCSRQYQYDRHHIYHIVLVHKEPKRVFSWFHSRHVPSCALGGSGGCKIEKYPFSFTKYLCVCAKQFLRTCSILTRSSIQMLLWVRRKRKWENYILYCQLIGWYSKDRSYLIRKLR